MAIHDKDGHPGDMKEHRAGGPRWADLCLRDHLLSYQGDMKESSPPPLPPPCDGSVHCEMTSLEEIHDKGTHEQGAQGGQTCA